MKFKITISFCFCILVILLGVGIGSVFIPPLNIIKVIISKLFFLEIPKNIKPNIAAIVWNVRLPRALTAFIAGGTLAVSGTIMQSVLKNPLASSYTLGISSGASLTAAISLIFTVPFLKYFSLPVAGMTGAMLSILCAVKFANAIDKRFSNTTIVLVGMTFSLFVNGIMTVLLALNREKLGQLIFWQMGSFATHGWKGFLAIMPVSIIGTLILVSYSREADVLTFGEEQALSIGVDTKKIKRILLFLSSGITGVVIAFVGVIGFVDLISPHVVRKFFGSSHKTVVPMAFIIGGTLMELCDLVSRTILSPIELPVGAVTAIIGAPFFAYVYFSKRKVKNA